MGDFHLQLPITDLHLEFGTERHNHWLFLPIGSDCTYSTLSLGTPNYCKSVIIFLIISDNISIGDYF